MWTDAITVCSSVRDGTHDTPKYVKNGIPLVTSKNLKKGQIDFSTVEPISYEDHCQISIRSGVESGDILFAMIGTIGNPVVIQGNQEFSIKNVGLFKKNESAINSYFLSFWLSSHLFEKIAEEKQLIKGTTQKFIPLGNLRALPIPFPPLKEQKRIVEKVEELLSELDKGIESLKTAQKQLKVYRQAVLKWAFEGKLTEAWRKQHSSTLKTGEALLAQIKAERESRYQQQLAEWETAVKEWEAIGKVGKKPTKPSTLKDVSLLTETELSELPKLPYTWCWLRFGELVSSIRGGTTAVPIDTSTDYPILRSSSVRAGTIDYSDVRFLTPEQASDIKDFVEVDDLLFTRLNGTADYVGNCSRVTEYYPDNLVYPDRLYCAKLLLANMAKYVEKVFENPILRRIIEKRAKSTAGHINPAMIETTFIQAA